MILPRVTPWAIKCKGKDKTKENAEFYFVG